MSQLISRRELLRFSTGAVLTSIFGFGCRNQASAFPCLRTPEQTEGPFYPVKKSLDENNDLTLIEGMPGRADGKVIYIRGCVVDRHCRPLHGTRVEIWQASAQGRYNHPRERRNPVALDENFQSWGHAITDSEGKYLFKTIFPGRYEASRGWIRPAHVHFKVSGEAHHDLTTQMYFDGDPYLDNDFILRNIPREQWNQVIIERQDSRAEFDDGSGLYVFNLTV